MQYIKLVDLQLTDVLMSTVVLLDVPFTLLQIWTKGQIGQLLHFLIPAIFLIGLLGPMGGTFVLTSLSLMFGGRLYAIKGGRWVENGVLEWLLAPTNTLSIPRRHGSWKMMGLESGRGSILWIYGIWICIWICILALGSI